MINHAGSQVAARATSPAFSETLLGPLGIGVVFDYGEPVGFAPDPPPSSFSLNGTAGSEARQIVVAFDATADPRHDAAVAGGREVLDAARALPEYHENDDAGFLHDLDEHNVKAINHPGPV